MPKIIFDLVSVSGGSHADDAVTFRAPRIRKSVTAPGIVTTRKERLEVPGGAESVTVEPGPIEIEIWAGGEFQKLVFDVPDVPEVYLSDFLDAETGLPADTVREFREKLQQIAAQKQGETGPQGDKGEPGAPGKPGPQGERGPAGEGADPEALADLIDRLVSLEARMNKLHPLKPVEIVPNEEEWPLDEDEDLSINEWLKQTLEKYGETFEDVVELPFELDTSSVTDMSYMFRGCSSLTDGNVRLTRNDGTKPKARTYMILGSGLTREPFYDTEGNPI